MTQQFIWRLLLSCRVFIAVLSLDVAGARANDARVLKDIEFASVDGHGLKLDLYLPNVDDPPLVVWIHGGGWRAGSKERCHVSWLTEHGYAVASISYRLTDKALFPAQIHDCKAAVRWLRAHAEQYGYEADRIAVGGSSAGGHLALLMGVSGKVAELEGNVGNHLGQSSAVQAIIDYYGPSDFVLRGKTQPDRAYTEKSGSFALLGGLRDGKVKRKTEQFASPATYVTKDDPPLLIFHGDEDRTVLLDQSQRIQQLYKAARLPVTLHVLEGAGHGGKDFYNGRQRELAVEFLDRQLRGGADKATDSLDEQSQRIDAMEKIADLALVPPSLNTSPLPEYDYDKLDYGMTIGIERTPGGRLWACWVAGGDSPKAFFVLATSDDDGETWSKPRLVVDAHANDLPRPRSILVGNLWTDPLGRLWLIFDQSMDMFDGRAGVWVATCANPDAESPTWSKPRRIWHGVTLNKPTVLSNGEWMMPISLDQRGGFGPFKGCFTEFDPLRGANVFVSTDQGVSWQRRGCVQFPNPNWHEHMVVERKDGTLWMLARTAHGIMESTSTDRGKTWSKPASSAIKHPVARFFIRRLASGNILLVKHGKTVDSHEGRSLLTAWLSNDEGQTWQGGLLLDERKGISYPDGFQAPDGTLYISYDRNRSTDGEILLARFTEEDVLAGKLTGARSKLQMLISRPLAGRKHQAD